MLLYSDNHKYLRKSTDYHTECARLLLNFADTMALYRVVSSVPFKCLDKPPKISVVDNQTEGYALKVKLDCAFKRCLHCCVKEFLKMRNLRVRGERKLDCFFLINLSTI